MSCQLYKPLAVFEKLNLQFMIYNPNHKHFKIEETYNAKNLQLKNHDVNKIILNCYTTTNYILKIKRSLNFILILLAI